MTKGKKSRIDWQAPGMRRVKLVTWWLFYKQVPLDREIIEEDEKAAAKHCHMAWDTYRRLKAEHAAVWRYYAARRKRAQAQGGFKPQPRQFRRQRKVDAPRKARMERRGRSARHLTWLYQEYARYARMKPWAWQKERLGNKLLAQIMGH